MSGEFVLLLSSLRVRDSHPAMDQSGPALGRCYAMIFNRLFLTLLGFSVCCFQPTAWAGGASGPAIEAGNQSAEMMGTGDGRIHVFPSLSKPSVKNGDKLVVSAVVKSQHPVVKVEADFGGVARVELKSKPATRHASSRVMVADRILWVSPSLWRRTRRSVERRSAWVATSVCV